MPGARHPDKVLVSLWMHRDIHQVIEETIKARGISKTRLILEALAEHLDLTLDAAGMPMAEKSERLEVQGVGNRKRTTGKRSPRRSAAETPSGRQAGESSETGKPGSKSVGPKKAG